MQETVYTDIHEHTPTQGSFDILRALDKATSFISLDARMNADLLPSKMRLLPLRMMFTLFNMIPLLLKMKSQISNLNLKNFAEMSVTLKAILKLWLLASALLRIDSTGGLLFSDFSLLSFNCLNRKENHS